MDMTAADRPATLSDRIAETLRARIVAGEIAQGEKLPPDAEIAAAYDASLPTVRGALRELIARGFLFARRGPRGGYFVRRPSLLEAHRLGAGMTGWLVHSGAISLTDILEARRILGHSAVAQAAQRRTERDLAAIDVALRKMSDASLGNRDFRASEIQFARAISVAGGNRLVLLLTLVATGAYATAAANKVFSFAERETLVDIAARIGPAIGSRQGEAAARLSDRFMECLTRIHFPVATPDGAAAMP